MGRSSSLRSRLTRTLVGLGLVSVVLLAAVNFVVVRELLDRTGQDQLVTLRELRSDSVELGIDRLLERVAVIGSDPGTSTALRELDEGYRALDGELSDDQRDELLAVYGDVVGVLEDGGVDAPAVDDLLPESEQGRAVQYEYVASNPNPRDERSELVDAGDGSAYSAAHARHHEFLRGVAASVGASDLLLVSIDSSDVVYSVEKRIDLGTDVTTFPYGVGEQDDGGGLRAVWERLGRSGVTDAVVVDSAFYLPDLSVPLLQVAAAVRDDTEVIGAVVVSISIDALTAIVTEQQQWDLLGLGDTGDAYVVGTDGRLRSIPRSWFDDPDAYVERYLDTGGDARTADLMRFTGSPVLLHEIGNDAVDAGRTGDDFIGTVANGLDRSALTASSPLALPGLDWILLTEQQTSETRDELESFLWSTLILLAVLLPILAIIGLVLARVFARPVEPLVAAARRIADGDFETTVDDLGRNELGDLGRQLNAMSEQLRDHEASIAAEEERITTMLTSVLPPDLAERVRAGERDVSQLVDTATVVVIDVIGLPEVTDGDQEAVIELTERLGEVIDDLRAESGIERIRAASDQQLFVAGRGRDGHAAGDAVEFASAAIDRVARVGSEFGVRLNGRAGLASGLVASGVLGSRQVSYGMWGDAVIRATELADAETESGVFLDRTVADVLDADVALEPVDLGDAYQVVRSISPDDPTVRAGAAD